MADQLDEFESAELARDLLELYPAVHPLPTEIDRRILNRARARLARPHRKKLLLRIAGGAAAAAAVLLLAVRLALPPQAPPQIVSAIPGDVNGDGSIDILDALVLARKLDAGRELQRIHDLTSDGVVDRRDVDAIAFAAVSLERGGVR